ncbi:hypothetical protein HY638_00320 [Candidatus Woesearchaeota archaeon]|nr:hypothetical protein [Candidatus Woesearchaeota archaeon]
MFTDVVVPNKNEGKFAEMAEKLGYGSICFLYSGEPRPLENLSTANVKIYSGSLHPAARGGIIFIKSSGDDRHALENLPVDSMFSLEENQGRDFLHHRASGLNHILCDIAKKNRRIITFTLASLFPQKTRPLVIGRIMQNIRLCRKYKVETAIASFAKSPYQMRSPHDIISLFSTLGMHPEEARKSLQSVEKRIKENQKRKEHGFYSENIQVLD